MVNEKITGQIMTRPMGNGKVMIFGLLQVPDGCALGAQDGRQFVVIDDATAMDKNIVLDTINLVIPRKVFTDHDAKGKAPNYLLTEPIWRV